MNTSIRPAIIVTVALLLALGALALCFTSNPTDMRILIQESRRREQLNQYQQAIIRRAVSKQHVAQEVIAQQCSLSEGIARLQEMDREWIEEMDREWPDSTAQLSEWYRQLMADPEMYYWYITNTVQGILRDRPNEAAVALRRLKKDYQQLQAGRQVPSTVPVKRIEQSR